MLSLLLYHYHETFVMKISQVLYFLTFLLYSTGIVDMNTFQAGDVEDWEWIERAMVSMDVFVVPSNVPRTKGGEASYAKISKENLPSSKEKNVPR